VKYASYASMTKQAGMAVILQAPNIRVEWIALLCIWEVTGSVLGFESGYLN